MKRPEPDTPDARRRAQAAADWLARRDRGLTAAEQDVFLQWLATDPLNGEWYALHRRTVGDFGALAQWRPEHSEEPNPDLLAPPRRRVPWFAPVILAAAAGIALAFGWRATPSTRENAPAVANELERRILADGSAVELNRGAVVTVAFTAAERRATLVRGEALFTVAKDSARPFVVRAGGVDVRAVGTAFSVRLDTATVEVLVTEGRVAVATPEIGGPGSEVRDQRSEDRGKGTAADAANPSSALRPPSSEISAGQRATVSRTGSTPPQIVAATPAETARLLAWHPHLLDFSSAPLEAAIAEFNRRNRVQFVLADSDLAAMPIVASIRSDNVEGFARFLANTPGVQVERRGDTEIVLRRKQ